MLLSRIYQFPKPNIEEKRFLDTLLTNNKFNEEFRLLKVLPNNGIKFRYRLTGKVGQINATLKIQEDAIILKVEETPFGFFLPIVFFIFSIVNYQDTSFSLFLLGVACFWFLYIFFFFHECKYIKKSLDFFCINSLNTLIP